MRVIGRADHHAIDLLVHLVQHHAKILKPTRLVKLLKTLAGLVLVDITHRHDIFAGDARHVRRTPSPDSDTSDVQFFVRRSRPGDHRRPQPKAAGDHPRCFQKVSAFVLLLSHECSREGIQDGIRMHIAWRIL